MNFPVDFEKIEEICTQNCINSEKVLTLQVRSGKVNLLTAGNLFLLRETQETPAAIRENRVEKEV